MFGSFKKFRAIIIHDQIEIDTGHDLLKVFILISFIENKLIFNGTVLLLYKTSCHLSKIA